MSTSSRRLSAKSKSHRNSHTPGKDKGGFCVKMNEAGIGVSSNPYKGQGLKGNGKAAYTRFWTRMYTENGIKRDVS